MAKLDLTQPGPDLCAALVDISSVSGTEQELADAVEAALSAYPHLTVTRHGNTVVARTELGRDERIVVAGHLDTVPLNDNLPARRADGLIHGLGACDMKGGVAVGLRLAATLTEPNRDITYVFYDCEEVESERNGLFKLTQTHPDLLQGVFAVVMEPSNAVVEEIAAAKARCGSRSPPAASGRTRPGPGWGRTRSTRQERSSTGWRRTSRGGCRSTDWSTAKG